MQGEGKLIFSNVNIYKAIADEAYETMRQDMETGRRPKPDGSPGWIKTFDPKRKSFKQAMISIVFTGVWLDAMLHLRIAARHGVKKFKDLRRQSVPYSERLRLAGCTDEELSRRVKSFRESRNDLVHENAYLDDGTIKTAQDEAEKAHELLRDIHKLFGPG